MNILKRLKQNYQEDSMFGRFFIWRRRKTLCSICKKSKSDPEYSGKCWKCYYKKLRGQK